MKIKFEKGFRKQHKKLDSKIKNTFAKRLQIFKDDKFNEILNNHKLHNPYSGCRSINITGNIRAIYYEHNEIVYFVAIGPHSELYE